MTSHTTEEVSGPEGDGPRRRRGPYAKSAATRQRILDVARDVFASVGYHGTSLRTIADRVGMTVPGVLHHFGGKEQVLLAVLEERDRLDRELTDALLTRPDVTPAAALRQLARSTTASPGMSRLFAMLAAEALDPQHPAHQFFQERNTALLEIGERLFDRAAAGGQLAADAPKRSTVLVIAALFEGLDLQSLRDPSIDLDEVISDFIGANRWLAPIAAGDPAG